MPKDISKNRTWYQTRKHVCAKARLRNPESCGGVSADAAPSYKSLSVWERRLLDEAGVDTLYPPLPRSEDSGKGVACMFRRVVAPRLNIAR